MAVVEREDLGQGRPRPGGPATPLVSRTASTEGAGSPDSTGSPGGTGIPGPTGIPGAVGSERVLKRSPLLWQLVVIAFLGWIYDWLQNLAPLRRNLAFSHARAVLSLEGRLGISPERSLNRWLDHHYVLAYVSSDFYDNAIFGVTLVLAAWIWWRRPDIYRPLRTNLVLANVIGFAVFWLYPVAPPRMLPGFVDVVAHVGGLGSWHKTLIDSADQFAAMPSMHLAWAAWCALVAWRLAGRGRWRWAAITIGVAYTLGTAFVVMGTANHYLLDVLAGIACTLVSGVVVEATPLPSLVCGAAVRAMSAWRDR